MTYDKNYPGWKEDMESLHYSGGAEYIDYLGQDESDLFDDVESLFQRLDQ